MRRGGRPSWLEFLAENPAVPRSRAGGGVSGVISLAVDFARNWLKAIPYHTW